MRLYIYAITDRPNGPLPDQPGLNDQALVPVIYRDVTAIVSAHAGAEPSQSEEELWRHEAVVEALMTDRTVLPVQFGTLASSQDEVGALLRRAYSAFTQDIERVRDHIEIGIRFLVLAGVSHANGAVASPPSSGRIDPETSPGTAYLRAKSLREQAAQRERQGRMARVWALYDVLAPHASASRLDDRQDDPRGVAGAFLVPRHCVEPFMRIVIGAADANPDLALLCTGPWPPYSFVGVGQDATLRDGLRHAC